MAKLDVGELGNLRGAPGGGGGGHVLGDGSGLPLRVGLVGPENVCAGGAGDRTELSGTSSARSSVY